MWWACIWYIIFSFLIIHVVVLCVQKFNLEYKVILEVKSVENYVQTILQIVKVMGTYITFKHGIYFQTLNYTVNNSICIGTNYLIFTTFWSGGHYFFSYIYFTSIPYNFYGTIDVLCSNITL